MATKQKKQKKPMAKTIIKAAVIIGVLIIPLLYSYFYLSAFWDPYSRLQDVSVAVVNLDKGAKINGKDRNVGKEICDNLEADGSLDFHFVSASDAEDGLMNDKYYAEILIPADLTSSISTASKNTKKQHAQIKYIANQKRNYLASQILESGMMPTIKETVNGAVNKEITATLTDKLYEVPDALEILKDGLQQLSDGAGSLKDGTQQLSTGTISLTVGTEKLAKGSKDLVSGLTVFKAGTAKLADGASQVDTGVSTLQSGAATLKAGTKQLNDNVPALKSGVKKLDDGANALADGASSLKDGSATLSSSLTDYTDGVASAADGSGNVVAGISQVQSGITALKAGVTKLETETSAGATDLAKGEKKLADGVDLLSTKLTAYTTGVDTLITNFETSVTLLSNAYPYISNDTVKKQVGLYLQNCNTEASKKQLEQIKQGKSLINAGIKNLQDGVEELQTDSATSMEKLLDGIGQVEAGVDTLNAGATKLSAGATTLQKGLTTLKSNNEALTNGASAIAIGAASLSTGADQLADGTGTLLTSSGTLANGVTKLDNGAGDLLAGVKALKAATAQLADGADQINTKTTTIQNGASQLQSGINQLNSGASQLESGAAKLDSGAAALKAGTDTAKDSVEEKTNSTNDQLKALDGLSDYSEEPVSTDTEHVQPVANYGSAFAPYFMSLSLWVGGLMIFFGIYLDYQKKIRILSKDSDHVVLRAFVFMLLGLFQAVLLAFVIRHALGIEVAHLGMLYLSCCLVSLTFISIIQFSLVHLGDAGKFVALFLLILQLTSCAGTFPIETCPTVFQKLYPFMPMTYSVRLFKEALAGNWDSSVTKDALILVVIMVVFTLATTMLSAYRDRHKIKEIVANGPESILNK